MARFEAVAAPALPQSFVAFVRGSFWYAVDMAVFLPLFFLYVLLRGLPTDRIELSTRNAFHIIDFEQSLGIFHEPAWQNAAQEHGRLIELANFTYLNLHMPLLVVLGLTFLLADARKHRVIRNAILLSAFLAVPIYAAFPVTPPRLMGSAGFPMGIFDTIPDTVRDKPGAMANWYAAVPSYHFGWIVLAAAGVWWCWKGWGLRIAAALFAAVMWWAIVVTGNHYFVDMLLGACMVAITFRLSLAFERWAERNPSKVERFTFRAGPLRLPV